MLCTKHPGFHEEKEWQVIYSPKFERSEYLKDDLQVIRGTPQPIVEIPLKNIPQEGFFGAAIPEILDRIIIGPQNTLWLCTRPSSCCSKSAELRSHTQKCGSRRFRSGTTINTARNSDTVAPRLSSRRRDRLSGPPSHACVSASGTTLVLAYPSPSRRALLRLLAGVAANRKGGRSCPVKPLWPVAAVRSRAREGTRRAARRARRVPSDPVS